MFHEEGIGLFGFKSVLRIAASNEVKPASICSRDYLRMNGEMLGGNNIFLYAIPWNFNVPFV